MATYAIGDIQGCFRTLKRLLKQFAYRPGHDRLWLAGDLVNRGPRSLDVLRWAMAQGDLLTAVLGNHDLHLLALAAGEREFKARDTLAAVLKAPDADAILEWVAGRPLLHRAPGWVLVHAGIPPFWSVERAETRAREIEQLLRSDRRRLLRGLYRGSTPAHVSEVTDEASRWRLTVAALTRMRAVRTDGGLDYDYSGPLGGMPAGLAAWFQVPGIEPGERVLFGHWAALGHQVTSGAIALDSGCVWGNHLTAYRLEDGAVFQQRNAER